MHPVQQRCEIPYGLARESLRRTRRTSPRCIRARRRRQASSPVDHRQARPPHSSAAGDCPSMWHNLRSGSSTTRQSTRRVGLDEPQPVGGHWVVGIHNAGSASNTLSSGRSRLRPQNGPYPCTGSTSPVDSRATCISPLGDTSERRSCEATR